MTVPPAARDALVEGTLAALDLGTDGVAHELLALDAVWLALVALGERVRAPLERLLAGRFWEEVLGLPSAGAPAAPLGAEGRPRVAVALVLLEAARAPDGGAAERTAAALAAVALGCADVDAGAAVQRGLGHLRLLELVRTVQVARRVRALAAEFRFRDLERRLPAAFVARVQDLLERLDAEGLLAVRLADRLGPARRDDGVALAALVRSASPRVTSLCRALARAGAPARSRAALLALAEAEAPDVWGRLPRARALREVADAYAALRRALAGSPFRALPGGRRGFGLARA